MNASEILSEQHRAIEDLFRAVDSTDATDGARLRELAQRLAAHMRIEEEITFPLARTLPGSADGPQTICAQVLRRMTDPSAQSDHAKLAKVVELADAHLDAYDDTMHCSIDHEMVEDIGESLACIFEEGVRVARSRAARSSRRHAPRRSTATRTAARRR